MCDESTKGNDENENEWGTNSTPRFLLLKLLLYYIVGFIECAVKEKVINVRDGDKSALFFFRCNDPSIYSVIINDARRKQVFIVQVHVRVLVLSYSHDCKCYAPTLLCRPSDTSKSSTGRRPERKVIVLKNKHVQVLRSTWYLQTNKNVFSTYFSVVPVILLQPPGTCTSTSTWYI